MEKDTVVSIETFENKIIGKIASNCISNLKIIKLFRIYQSFNSQNFIAIS